MKINDAVLVDSSRKYLCRVLFLTDEGRPVVRIGDYYFTDEKIDFERVGVFKNQRNWWSPFSKWVLFPSEVNGTN